MVVPFTLETLSPVHIGNGLKLYRDIDFFRFEDHLYMLEEKKLRKKLGEERYQSLLSLMISDGDIVDFYRGFSKEDWESVSGRAIKFKGEWAGDELAVFMQDGMGRAYIPGSGLKGGLTTLLAGFLLKGVHLDSKDLQDNKGRYSDTKLLKQSIGDGFSPQSFSRFLQVADLRFMEVPDTEYFVLKVFNQYAAGRGYEWRFKPNTQMGLEVLNEGAKAKGRIKIDSAKLNQVGELNQSGWIKKLFPTGAPGYDSQEFTITLIKAWKKQSEWIIKSEANFWDDDEMSNFSGFEDFKDRLSDLYQIAHSCGENEMVIRLGAGQGHKSITGGILARAYQEDKIDVDDYVNLIRELRRRDYPSEIYFPKTRKMNQLGYPLGFAKITFDI